MKSYGMSDIIKYSNKLEKVSTFVRTGISPFSDILKYLTSLNIDFILIGGLASSHYMPARFTEDVDILVRSEDEFLKLKQNTMGSVKWIRGHAFLLNGVEVEILTPEFVNMPSSIATYIFNTSVMTDGFKIPSTEGVLLSKLVALREIDKQDIQSIIKTQGTKIDFGVIYSLIPSQEAKEFLDITINKLKFILED